MQVQEDKPYDEINITPMLDLSYVLLVIFIIMCTASVQDLKVKLPSASAKTSAVKPKTKAVTISNDGKIYLDAIPVSLAELETRLRDAKARDPDLPVVVRGDSATPYQGVMDVIDVLTRLGISSVGLATKPKDSK